jgi:hypothetical protein
VLAAALMVLPAVCALAASLPDPKTGNRGGPLRLLFIVPRDGWQPKAEIDTKYRQHLEGQGFSVKVILGTCKLTLDYLKQFNCVVVPGLDGSRLIGYHAPHLLELIA